MRSLKGIVQKDILKNAGNSWWAPFFFPFHSLEVSGAHQVFGCWHSSKSYVVSSRRK